MINDREVARMCLHLLSQHRQGIVNRARRIVLKLALYPTLTPHLLRCHDSRRKAARLKEVPLILKANVGDDDAHHPTGIDSGHLAP